MERILRDKRVAEIRNRSAPHRAPRWKQEGARSRAIALEELLDPSPFVTDLARDQVVRDRPISFYGVVDDDVAGEILLPRNNVVVVVDDDVVVWQHPEMCRLLFPFPVM